MLCELVWVLTSAYRIPRSEVVRHLGTLLRARQLAFRSSDRIAAALASFGLGRGDFADSLIREEALAAGCEGVATLDRAARGRAEVPRRLAGGAAPLCHGGVARA